jgi:hypothetical protein
LHGRSGLIFDFVRMRICPVRFRLGPNNDNSTIGLVSTVCSMTEIMPLLYHLFIFPGERLKRTMTEIVTEDESLITSSYIYGVDGDKIDHLIYK